MLQKFTCATSLPLHLHIAALRSAMNNNKAETVASWTGLIGRLLAPDLVAFVSP